MRVLGIDPGTRVAGYGIVDIESSSRTVSAISAGVWRLPAESQLPERLSILAQEFQRALDVYKPDVVCIELAFVAVNVRSALMLGHARGVFMERAHTFGIPVVEVSATAVKLAVMGHGRGDKKMVAHALSCLLKIDFGSLPLDASDALGIAYTYAIDPGRAAKRAKKCGQGKKKSTAKQWQSFFSKVSAAAILVFFTPFVSTTLFLLLSACSLNFGEPKMPREAPTPVPTLLGQASGGVGSADSQKKPLPNSINTGAEGSK